MSILVLASLTFAASAQAAGQVLFDTGHREPFRIDAAGELQLSGLAEALKASGAKVGTIKEPFSDATLEKAGALVISGPFAPLTPAEIDALVRFMERGGKVAIMLHIAPPMAPLLDRLSISHTIGPVLERQNLIDNDPLRFRVERLGDHPVMKGLQDFSLYGAWGLVSRDDSARVIAATGPQAWIDLNMDRVQAKEETAKFAVAVAGEVGKGGFVVFGDDAIFQNRFLKGNNKKLAGNLARWLK